MVGGGEQDYKTLQVSAQSQLKNVIKMCNL